MRLGRRAFLLSPCIRSCATPPDLRTTLLRKRRCTIWRGWSLSPHFATLLVKNLAIQSGPIYRDDFPGQATNATAHHTLTSSPPHPTNTIVSMPSGLVVNGTRERKPLVSETKHPEPTILTVLSHGMSIALSRPSATNWSQCNAQHSRHLKKNALTRENKYSILYLSHLQREYNER